jgi:hypothetical protein
MSKKNGPLLAVRFPHPFPDAFIRPSLMMSLMFDSGGFTPPIPQRLVPEGEVANLIQRTQTHKCIKHSAVGRGFTEKRGDEVKAEESDQAPVEASKNEQYSSYYI